MLNKKLNESFAILNFSFFENKSCDFLPIFSGRNRYYTNKLFSQCRIYTRGRKGPGLG